MPHRSVALLTTIAFVTALGLAAAPGTAQKRTRLYADEDKSYEVRIPWWLEAVPTKPGDEQTLAKFQGSRKWDRNPFRGEHEVVLRVIRIRKGPGPTTGKANEPEEPEGEETPTSLVDQRLAYLNGATTLSDYLTRRLGQQAKSVDRYDDLFPRPLEDDEDREFVVYQNQVRTKGTRHSASIRAFVQETESEIFGIVATGLGINPFHPEITRAVLTLKREVRKSERDDEDDPYAESAEDEDGNQLLDLAGRRAVRADLVKGWEAYDSVHFILVTNVSSKRLIDTMLVDLEIMRSAYLERFPPVADADMNIVSTVRVCDGYEDYLRYAGKRLYGTGGYWNFIEEELVLFNPERAVPRALEWTRSVDPVAVLYHEAMHQYFYYSNRSAAPASWFNEGYGEVFGGARLSRRKGEVRKIDRNDFRMQWLRKDRKDKVPPPALSRLLRMTQREFYGRGALANYAYGWAFCFFLEKQRDRSERVRNDLWANLPDNYLVELRKAMEAERAKLPPDSPDDLITAKQDQIQAAAIEAVLKDIDLNELQSEWERFLVRL